MAEYFPFLSWLGNWNWLILGVILLAVEIAMPGMFLIWFAMAAFITGLASFALDVSWQVQFVIFAASSVLSVYLGRQYARVQDSDTDRPFLNRRGDQFIGRRLKVAQAISNGRGRVYAGDSIWIAEGPDVPEGSMVEVVGSRGTTLIVKKAQES